MLTKDMELKNNHNVYILGAGFSREAGLPIVSDFLTRMRDSHPWLISKERTLEAAAVKNVLEFRLQAASAAYWTNLDLENIEELFSLASASTPNISNDIQLAIAATLDFALASSPKKSGVLHFDSQSNPLLLKPWIKAGGNPHRPLDYLMPLYTHHVAKLLGMFDDGDVKGDNTFITFNYDTVLEDALQTLQVPFSYGLGKQTKNLDASAKVSREETSVNVLKLHGSMNWARKKVAHGRSFTVYGNYADVLKAGAVPELVPPTWKKTFQGQLGDVWNSSVKCLRTATRVMVIGFSLPPTDLHFKYLIAAGLQQNVSLRQITFCNPAATELKERARIGFRSNYVDSGKISFLDIAMGVLASRNDPLGGFGRPINPDGGVHFSGF